MDTKHIVQEIESISMELIAMREKCENYRTVLKYIATEVKGFEKEMKKYTSLKQKGLLVTLPVPIGSMTYKVVLDTKDPSGKTYKYTQHVFSWEDMPEVGKTVFTSDTEAMVVAIDMTKAEK